MKKIAFLILFIPCALYANAYTDIAEEIMAKVPAKQKKATIAVMPFSGEESNAKIATVETAKAFVDAEANVVERDQIDKILEEQALQQAGVISDESAASVGKASGAKYIIIGTTTRFNKYGVDNNDGIKISVKLVEVSTYKTIAASTQEVSADDGVSKYTRKEPKKDVSYPGFLEFYGGLSKLHYKGKFDAVYQGNDMEYETDMDRGFLAGLRLTGSRKGFFASTWEFGYRQHEKKDWDFKAQIFDISWNPTIRIPLWNYIEALPSYTNIYGGIAAGLAYEKVKYKNIDTDETRSGFGFVTSARAGFKLGLGESIALFSEYRYYFKIANKIYRTHAIGNTDGFGYDSFTGHSIIMGVSLAP